MVNNINTSTRLIHQYHQVENSVHNLVIVIPQFTGYYQTAWSVPPATFHPVPSLKSQCYADQRRFESSETHLVSPSPHLLVSCISKIVHHDASQSSSDSSVKYCVTTQTAHGKCKSWFQRRQSEGSYLRYRYCWLIGCTWNRQCKTTLTLEHYESSEKHVTDRSCYSTAYLWSHSHWCMG